MREIITFLVACPRTLSQLHRRSLTNLIFLILVVLVSVSVCTGCSTQQSPVEQLLACKFPGTWEGEAFHSSVGNFPVTIKLDEFKKDKICGSFEAPAFSCGGELECVDIQAYGYPYTTGVYVVRNHEYGKCVAGFQHLIREDDNTLTGALFEYNEEFAYGTYHRTNSPVDPAKCEPKDALKPFVAAGEGSINIHSSPGTNYPVIDTLLLAHRGRVIIGRNADSSWWQVSTDNGPGWIDASVVTAKNIEGFIPVVEAPLSTVDSVPPSPITPQPNLTEGRHVLIDSRDPLKLESPGPGVVCRENAGRQNNRVTLLEDGDVTTIRGGPSDIIDGYIWWKVETPDGKLCWVVGNWLFPIVSDIPPIDTTILPTPELTCNQPFSEGHDGYDCQEKYMLELLNNYRQKNGCKPENNLVHDPNLQAAAENWAKNAPIDYHHSISDEVMADVSDKTDLEGAMNALYCSEGIWCWSRSRSENPQDKKLHHDYIVDCSYIKAGVGHARTGDRQNKGWKYEWAWVVQFGK